MPQIFFCNKIRPTQVEAFSDREIAHIWKNHLVMQRNSNSSQMDMLNVYIVVSMRIQKYDLILFNSKLMTLKKNETTKIKL